MRSINDVTLLGNLGSDPEVWKTDENSRGARLSVATNRNYKQNGEWTSDTEWHRIVAWGYEAGKAAELSKGDAVAIQGRLQTREWTGDDGETRETTEIRAHRVVPLQPEPSPPTREEKQIEGATEGDGEFTEDALLGDDDLPF